MGVTTPSLMCSFVQDAMEAMQEGDIAAEIEEGSSDEEGKDE